MSKFFSFFLFLLFGVVLVLPVYAMTDKNFDALFSETQIFQNKNKLANGKFVYLPSQKLGNDTYQVDEYETPCYDGLNPTICFGWQVTLQNSDGTKKSKGQGKLAETISTQTLIDSGNNLLELNQATLNNVSSTLSL